MKNTVIEKNLSSPFSKIIVYGVILLFIFMLFSLTQLILIASSADSLEWSVTLDFDEPDGANDYVIFGEALDASDGLDDYDIPNPPAGMTPYINTWFDAGLDEPYNKLKTDIRIYPDNYKIWNLYVQWVPSDYTSSANITISWSNSNIYNSGYNTVILYDYTNEIIVADLLTENSYIYNSLAMVPHHFQIICNSTGSIVNNPPYTPASPSPSNGSTEISITTIFNWVGGDPDPDDTVTYNVYFGTNSIPPLVINNQSITTYNPGTLNYDTRYYWRITTWDNHGDYAEGPIWHFTTEYKTPPTQYNKPPIADANGPYKGYINQTITFDGSKSYDTDGVIEYYRWDFNYDGSWDTEWIESETITYVYSNAGNYTVSLEVKDDKQATDTHTSLITILPIKDGEIPPVANANGPYLGHINQNITFNASGSYDMDGTIINYNWDFGDGITNSSMNPTHVYTINGTYTVILVVIDKSGLTDTDKTTSYIFILDTDEDGWGDNEEKKYGTDPNNPKDYPLDSDNDHIPDFEDTDDDNDGLSDTLEGKLGSNLKNKSDVESISINGITHFLVDTDEDSKIDLFYNSSSGKITYIYYKDKNQYLIDDDGDGQWDYIYDTAGALSPYIEEKTSHPSNMSFIIFPLLIIILIVAIFVIIIKVGYRKS